MRAVGYCRVSSVEQIENTSIQSQKQSIEAYCALKSLDLVAIYNDPGVSGSIPLSERPEGSRMVDVLNRGEAETVIITRLDRGFRSASNCLVTIEDWERKGISLHVTDLGGNAIDTSSSAGKFMLIVLSGAAEMERLAIKERCQRGREARRQQGKRIGEVPYGWDIDDTNTLVRNTTEEETLNLILELKSQGLSVRGIAQRLNDLEIPTKKTSDKGWSHNQVHRLLKRAA